VRGRVVGIDLEKRRVSLAMNGRSRGTSPLHGVTEELPFDHIVLALGSVTNYPSAMQNVKEFALDFKTLLDAMRIRNRVIEMFERADRASDVGRRQELLTFVIAGGGFAGVRAGTSSKYEWGWYRRMTGADDSSRVSPFAHEYDGGGPGTWTLWPRSAIRRRSGR